MGERAARPGPNRERLHWQRPCPSGAHRRDWSNRRDGGPAPSLVVEEDALSARGSLEVGGSEFIHEGDQGALARPGKDLAIDHVPASTLSRPARAHRGHGVRAPLLDNDATESAAPRGGGRVKGPKSEVRNCSRAWSVGAEGDRR